MTRSIAARVTAADTLPALVAYIVVLVAIPSELIVRPLGAAGTPAQIVAVGMLCWWLASRILTRQPLVRTNPVKWLLLLFAVSILASYVAGMSRPVTFGAESSSADRSLLTLCAWCGVVLLLADGITSRARLESLLKVLAAGVTGIAILGMFQFFLRIDIAHIIRIPGLTANQEFGDLIARSAYRRVSGTTSHPIEFGVVLASVLPLVIHFARFSPTQTQRRRWWLATVIVGVALPLSVARSGMIGALIVVLYLFHTWPPRLRVRMLVAGAVGVVAMSVVVPGLLGTIKSLFLNASSDPSTQGRTADYAPIFRYTAQHPLFGRGTGTFIPSIFRTLDNQYLATLVDSGIVGLLALLTLFIGTGIVAGAARRHSSSESTRDLGQCLKAGIAVVAVNSATFDSLGFSMCAGITFLLIGATGSLWAIGSRRRALPTARNPIVGHRWLAAAGIFLVAAFGLAAKGVVDAQPEFQAYGTVLVTPSTSRQTALASASDANKMASILHDAIVSQPVRETLRQHAATNYEATVGDGSLMMDSDVLGAAAPTLRLVSVADNPVVANAALSAVIREAGNQLTLVQSKAGVPPAAMMQLQVIQQSPAFAVDGRPTRAYAGFVILLITAGTAFYQGIRRQRSSAVQHPPSGDHARTGAPPGSPSAMAGGRQP